MLEKILPFDNRYVIAFIFTLLGVIMFSAKGIFIKFAYEYQVDSITLLTIRMAIAVPIYLLIGFYSERFHQERISKQQLSFIACFGIVGYYLASFLDMHGLQYISVSLERVILYLYPTFVLLLTAIILKQRVTRKEVVSLLVAYSGVVFIFAESINNEMDNIVLGGVLVALSALAFAVFLIGSDKHIKIVGSVRFTAYAMSAAGAAVFVHYLLSGKSGLLSQHQQVYYWGGILAVLSTILPTFLMAHGMKVLGVKNVSFLGVIGPVATMVMGVIFLGEVINFTQGIGIALVISAVSFIVISNKTDKDKQ